VPPAEGYPALPEWAAVVSVRRDPELRAELLERLARTGPVRAIGVTDLLALRRAFWRATTSPLEISPDRMARIDQGRWLHRHLGLVLGPETALEVRVRRAGCVGRIDGFADAPIEVKTGASLAEPSDLRDSRPDHVEQLAMYCAMTGRPSGRLVAFSVEGEEVRGLRTADLAFRDLPTIVGEMTARAEALRRAIADETAAGLPRCRWFGRGCEFQLAGRCHCSGEEPEGRTTILDEIASVAARPDLDAVYRGRLARLPKVAQAPTLERFRDLLYPRRAYFERTAPAPERSLAIASPAETPDLYARIAETIESGPIGEVARLPPRAEEPAEDVTGFRGTPYLLRTTRAWDPIAPEDLIRRSPQYPLELGYRCAVTGTSVGRVVLGYERAAEDRDRLQVFEVRFSSVTPFARRVRQVGHDLEEAIRSRRPEDLAACPDWMYSDCPYAAECACGVSAPRSHR
jgi:hypothetical protein